MFPSQRPSSVAKVSRENRRSAEKLAQRSEPRPSKILGQNHYRIAVTSGWESGRDERKVYWWRVTPRFVKTTGVVGQRCVLSESVETGRLPFRYRPIGGKSRRIPNTCVVAR
jgi:hypothetical protein